MMFSKKNVSIIAWVVLASLLVSGFAFGSVVFRSIGRSTDTLVKNLSPAIGLPYSKVREMIDSGLSKTTFNGGIVSITGNVPSSGPQNNLFGVIFGFDLNKTHFEADDKLKYAGFMVCVFNEMDFFTLGRQAISDMELFEHSEKSRIIDVLYDEKDWETRAAITINVDDKYALTILFVKRTMDNFFYAWVMADLDWAVKNKFEYLKQIQ